MHQDFNIGITPHRLGFSAESIIKGWPWSDYWFDPIRGAAGGKFCITPFCNENLGSFSRPFKTPRHKSAARPSAYADFVLLGYSNATLNSFLHAGHVFIPSTILLIGIVSPHEGQIVASLISALGDSGASVVGSSGRANKTEKRELQQK